MSDVHSLPRWKRLAFCFSILFCLISVNLSVFSVRSSANAIDSNIGSTVVLGSPVNAYFDMHLDSVGSSYPAQDLTVFVPNLNVYKYSSSGTPDWFGYVGMENNGSSGQNIRGLYQIDYSEVTAGAYDLNFICRAGNTRLRSLEVSESVIASSFDDLKPFNFQVTYPTTESCAVTWFYRVAYTELEPDGTTSVSYRYISSSYTFSSMTQIPFYNSSILNSSFFSDYADFLDSDGNRCVWIQSATVSFYGGSYLLNGGVYYFDYTLATPANYYDYMNDIDDRLISIYDSDVAVIDFEDVSWTSWLVSSVGAFMDFQIVPNLSIAGLLGLLIGVSLLMAFLKIFAGG